MSTIKVTPTYWQQFPCEVLVMVKQLGIPTYFFTLSCADLRLEGLSHIINNLNKLGLGGELLRNLTYQEQCNLFNSNAVQIDRHNQYKVEVLFKEIILDGLLGKTKYYALRVEVQKAERRHNHTLV